MISDRDRDRETERGYVPSSSAYRKSCLAERQPKNSMAGFLSPLNSVTQKPIQSTTQTDTQQDEMNKREVLCG
jgi:hypothetical protein